MLVCKACKSTDISVRGWGAWSKCVCRKCGYGWELYDWPPRKPHVLHDVKEAG